MASLNSVINVNVPTNIKEEATNLFNSLGLNMSTAINMFLVKSINEWAIPFEVSAPKPNKEVREALKEADDIMSGKIPSKGYHNVREMFSDLDKEIEKNA